MGGKRRRAPGSESYSRCVKGDCEEVKRSLSAEHYLGYCLRGKSLSASFASKAPGVSGATKVLPIGGAAPSGLLLFPIDLKA